MRGAILSFDDETVRRCADIIAVRRRLGRPVETDDAMIAAICRQHDALLSTRNSPDFDHTGIEVINPWEDTPDQDSTSSGVR